MEKKGYTLGSGVICGCAYENAIMAVADIVNSTFGTNYTYVRDWMILDELASKLGVRFDVNGFIVK